MALRPDQRHDVVGGFRPDAPPQGVDAAAHRDRPKSASARKLLPEITVVVAAEDLALAAAELRFADGSRLRNDFTNVVKNAAIGPDRFTSPVDATWKVTEPLKK